MNMDCAFPKGTDENNHEEQLLTIFGELNLIWSYVFFKMPDKDCVICQLTDDIRSQVTRIAYETGYIKSGFNIADGNHPEKKRETKNNTASMAEKENV